MSRPEPAATRAAARPADGWRVLPVESGDPDALLAHGQALLDALAVDPVPTLRWYRATSQALVLGRGQADVAAAAKESGIPILTRYTGGGAVLLDSDVLSLDVLLPAGHPLLVGDLSSVFVRIGQAWAGALADLGVPDVTLHTGAGTARRRGTPRERLLAAVCYATVGRGEVLAGGRKLVGLAQRRRRPGALVQCGLLRRWRPARLLAALGADPHDTDVAHRAVGLDELVDPPPPDGAIMEGVRAALAGYGRKAP